MISGLPWLDVAPVAMGRRAVLMLPESERPHPGASYRCRVYLQDAPDNGAICQHVVVLIIPLAGRTRGRCPFEDERLLVHSSVISLRRYLRADGHQRAVAGQARSRSLVDECHGTSARAAVCGDEHFILVTCCCTCTRAAIDTDNAKRICSGRTCRSRGTGRTGLASRTSWPWRSWFPLFARWTRSARFSLWSLGALTAARQAKRERNYESNAFCSHDSHLDLGTVERSQPYVIAVRSSLAS